MCDPIDETDPQQLRIKINSETAKIPWKELQRFFASGKTRYVTPELDLVDVALALQQDDSGQLEKWLSGEQILGVTNEQAREWIDQDSQVWAVVVKPWVLVQDLE